MDNFYSAPALAIKLKFMKTDCDGTLLPNRKLRKGKITAQNSGPVCAEMA
jgi:hypothetical protein